MKRLLAVLVALLMLTGCVSLSVSSEVKPAKVGIEAVEVGKTEASFEISVEWQGKPSGYGWVLYDSLGQALKQGESETPGFTVTDLKEGCNYYISAWAQTGDDRPLAKQLLFETQYKYSGTVARGIDVSRWQENIDWAKVAADNIDFAVLRIGYSGGVDRCFEEHYQGATAAGLDVGVYLYSYATTVEQAKKDAADVISTLKGRKLTYPVYYDIEDECQAGLDRARLTAIADAFCSAIEAAGYTAGIYTSYYNLIDCLDGDLLASKYQLWVAQVADTPPTTTNYQTVQYSHTGSVNGIKGKVDLNVSYVRYD